MPQKNPKFTPGPRQFFYFFNFYTFLYHFASSFYKKNNKKIFKKRINTLASPIVKKKVIFFILALHFITSSNKSRNFVQNTIKILGINYKSFLYMLKVIKELKKKLNIYEYVYKTCKRANIL